MPLPSAAVTRSRLSSDDSLLDLPSSDAANVDLLEFEKSDLPRVEKAARMEWMRDSAERPPLRRGP